MNDLEKNASAWRDFYNAEQAFMQLLVNTSICFSKKTGHEPVYSQTVVNGKVSYLPPTHICWVGQTQMPKTQFDMHLKELKSLYDSARGDKIVTRYPSRFPQFFESVDQVNVIQNTAFSSLPVNPNAANFTVFESGLASLDQSQIDADMLALTTAGFTPTYKTEKRTIMRAEYTVSMIQVPTKQLFDYANATTIQQRRASGTAYRGNLRHAGESFSRRINIGFVLVDATSNLRVVNANPQAPRPHSLAAAGALIQLPVTTPYQLYKKD